jgi:hypothetical protein
MHVNHKCLNSIHFYVTVLYWLAFRHLCALKKNAMHAGMCACRLEHGLREGMKATEEQRARLSS